jgi:hypothetical protein
VSTDAAVDHAGNLYVGGCFEGTIDLDPGPGVDQHVSNGGRDAFLVRLDGDGNFLWGRTWGSAIEYPAMYCDYVLGLSADYAGRVYAVGAFQGTCDFDPGPGEAIYEADEYDNENAFLIVFNEWGEFLWARAWISHLSDFAYSTAAEPDSGDVYVYGQFGETIDFDPGPGVDEHTAINDEDSFLTKLDSAGNFIWAGTWASDDFGYVTLDEFKNVLVAGVFGWIVDFDPGPGVEERKSIQYSGHDFYLSKFSPQCEFQWVQAWGGDKATFPSGDDARGVACGPSGFAYVTGYVDGTCDFDPGPGVDEHAAPEWDPIHAFLTKFGPDGVW